MKLPRGASAIVDIRKIRGYCLSKGRAREKHKAQVFEDALGMNSEHSDELRHALRQAARQEDAAPGTSDQYGNRHIIDVEL
jgi:hypothetical protein